MANIIPEKGLDFKVYLNGTDMLGVAEGNFPNIEYMTSEIRGAGIAGVAESIAIGHINSMTVSLTWRTITKYFAMLMAPVVQDLDFYTSHQAMDAATGIYVTQSIHVYMKAVTKTGNLGNLVIADTTGTQTEHEIYYFKLEIDDKEYIELDKYNYICKINGVDYLAKVRADLGM